MTPCNDRWRDELAGHILGSPASAGLNEHLKRCAICTATFREWSTQMRRIDAGVRLLTDSEPAAHAALHIIEEVRARRQRAWRPGWRWQTAALGGLVITGASLAYVNRAREQARDALAAASAISSWRSPTKALLRSSADPWLKTPPKLGKYFYQPDSNVPRKERENP